MSHLRLLGPPASSYPPRRPALAPALTSHGPVPPEHDLLLGKLARRAIDGDRDALSALHAAYRPRLDGWVRRARRACFRSSADPALEPCDIEQQAFVVFADLLLAWDGDYSLSAYLIANFPWRLSDAVRSMSRGRVLSSPLGAAALDLADGSFAAEESLALLRTLAASLPSRHGQILQLRIGDGMTWREVAVALGVTERTVLRDWKLILRSLRPAPDPG